MSAQQNNKIPGGPSPTASTRAPVAVACTGFRCNKRVIVEAGKPALCFLHEKEARAQQVNAALAARAQETAVAQQRHRESKSRWSGKPMEERHAKSKAEVAAALAKSELIFVGDSIRRFANLRRP